MTYYQIHQLKEQGFKKAAIVRKLSLSWNTVKTMYDKTPEELEEFLRSLESRQKKLAPYRDHILSWLKEHPDLSGAQILDWLEERCNYKEASEGTVRNYVNELREVHHIPKEVNQRIYETVPELPMGVQGQVDFGQDTPMTSTGERKRLYCIAFVLSHSRFKYVEWLDRPFRTEDVVRCHENAFQFYGGMPQEMVYDQDALISVSENAGDLLFTAKFEKYRKLRKFQIYLCRKSDPESKGKIEQVVKYVKGNFSKNRTYDNLVLWNELTIKWLARTGNRKVHHNTKKRPVEVHALEKQHLKPVSSLLSFENSLTKSITRTIHKDNVIRYGGNRYTVPAGTYHPNSANKAHVSQNEKGQLLIRLKPDGIILAKHLISEEKGKVIRDPAHKKEQGSKSTLLIHQIKEFFQDQELITWYLDELKRKYPRHLVDQLKVMKTTIETHPEQIEHGLEQAKLLNLISANHFRDIVYSLAEEAGKKSAVTAQENTKFGHLKAVERPIDFYVHMMGGQQP